MMVIEISIISPCTGCTRLKYTSSSYETRSSFSFAMNDMDEIPSCFSQYLVVFVLE